jgi:hypothetical protein
VSVFLYSPILIAALAALVAMRRRDPATMTLLAGEFGVMLIFYAWFTHWDGERSYGPRYLLPVVPLLVMPLAPWLARSTRAARRLAGVALLAGALVQVPGVLVDFSKVGFTTATPFTWEERRWTWAGSALHLNTQASMSAVPTNIRYLSGIDRPPAEKAAEGEARDFSEQYSFSLDFWWVYLFYMGVISAPVAVLVGSACVVATAFLALRLIRLLRREP